MFLYFLNTIPFCNKLLKKLLNNKTKNEDKKEKILTKDIIKVIMTTTSVILFNLSSDSNKEKNKEKNSSYFGIIVLVISLFTDGLLSLKESMIKTNIMNDKKYEGYINLLSWEYMNIFSFFTFTFSFSQIIYNLFFILRKCLFRILIFTFFNYLHFFINNFNSFFLIFNILINISLR